MGHEERRFNSMLRELTEGGDEQRKYAVIELGYSKNPAAIPHLEAAALHDESPEVRAYAITAYGLLAGLSGVSVLVLSMDTPMARLHSRSIDALERILGNCGTSQELDLFEGGLEEGIGKLGDKADARVTVHLDRLREKLTEKRRALGAKMGGELLTCSVCGPKHDKPSQKKKLKG